MIAIKNRKKIRKRRLKKRFLKGTLRISEISHVGGVFENRCIQYERNEATSKRKGMLLSQDLVNKRNLKRNIVFHDAFRTKHYRDDLFRRNIDGPNYANDDLAHRFIKSRGLEDEFWKGLLSRFGLNPVRFVFAHVAMKDEKKGRTICGISKWNVVCGFDMGSGDVSG